MDWRHLPNAQFCEIWYQPLIFENEISLLPANETITGWTIPDTNLISYEHDVAQARQLQLDDLLNQNRRNVFSSGRHDQLFDPAGDLEEPVAHFDPEVSGSKPAIFGEDFPGLCGVVEVAHHHVPAFHHDLATLVAENLFTF